MDMDMDKDIRENYFENEEEFIFIINRA